MDAYLSVVPDRQTGLFHGAVYRSRTTPSGSERWLLATTLKEGFASIRKAAASANAEFPELKPIDLDKIEDFDLSAFSALPAGSRLTVIRPKDAASRGNADEECEIVAPDGRRIGIPVRPQDVKAMLEVGRIFPDSSSGDDPELDCRYDHYVFGGRA